MVVRVEVGLATAVATPIIERNTRALLAVTLSGPPSVWASRILDSLLPGGRGGGGGLGGGVGGGKGGGGFGNGGGHSDH